MTTTTTRHHRNTFYLCVMKKKEKRQKWSVVKTLWEQKKSFFFVFRHVKYTHGHIYTHTIIWTDTNTTIVRRVYSVLGSLYMDLFAYLYKVYTQSMSFAAVQCEHSKYRTSLPYHCGCVSACAVVVVLHFEMNFNALCQQISLGCVQRTSISRHHSRWTVFTSFGLLKNSWTSRV